MAECVPKFISSEERQPSKEGEGQGVRACEIDLTLPFVRRFHHLSFPDPLCSRAHQSVERTGEVARRLWNEVQIPGAI